MILEQSSLIDILVESFRDVKLALFGFLVAEHCTEVRFASFLSGGFITAIVVNPTEMEVTKRTSVHCLKVEKAWPFEQIFFLCRIFFLENRNFKTFPTLLF